jgi:hypothetical protein
MSKHSWANVANFLAPGPPPPPPPQRSGSEVEAGMAATRLDFDWTVFLTGGDQKESGAAPGCAVQAGRPNFGKVFQSFFPHEEGGGRGAAVVCGPQAMMLEVQRQAVTRGLDLHSEEFGW